MENEAIRLNKYLSEAGICSRREADRLILEGKVFVDGFLAQMGQKVVLGQTVVCQGQTIASHMDNQTVQNPEAVSVPRTVGDFQPVQGPKAAPSSQPVKLPQAAQGFGDIRSHRAAPVLLAVNKPPGIVCTTSHKDRAPNIVDMVNYPVRVYPMGRLDKDSEGLILLTNQGELANELMRGANGHEKEYEVTVNRPVMREFIKNMEKGVYLRELKVKTRPCILRKTGEKAFRIILTQGLNRQIRRMCGELGYRVMTLKRVRIMNIRLGDLKPGEYREVTKKEWEELNRLLKMRRPINKE